MQENCIYILLDEAGKEVSRFADQAAFGKYLAGAEGKPVLDAVISRETGNVPRETSTEPVENQQPLIFRHGETEANRTATKGKPTDELNETGRKQAEDLGESLKEKGITTILSSDYTRARQTAELASKNAGEGVKTEIDKGLREKQDGETDFEFVKRVKKEKEKLDNLPPETAVIGHGLFMKAVNALDQTGGDVREASKIYKKLPNYDNTGQLRISEDKFGNRGQNVVPLSETEQHAKDIESGRAAYSRFSPDEQRGFRQGGRIHEEASLITGRKAGTGETQDERNDRQERDVERYAKGQKVWLKDAPAELEKKYGKPIASGNEALVYDNGQTVIKSKNTYQYRDLQEALDGITLHNTYFPKTALKVLGFGKNKDGDFQIIIEQPYIKEGDKKATQQEITDYLDKMGFSNIQHRMETDYKNDQILLHDVNPDNVVLTPGGEIAVIDPIMMLNTPDHKYDGKRETPINEIIPIKQGGNYATTESKGPLQEGGEQGGIGQHPGIGTPREEETQPPADNSNLGAGGKGKEKISSPIGEEVSFEHAGDENTGKIIDASEPGKVIAEDGKGIKYSVRLNNIINASEGLRNWLESKKIDTGGKLYSGLPFDEVYNAALKSAVKSLQSAEDFLKGVQQVVDYLQEHLGNDWDKDKVLRMLSRGAKNWNYDYNEDELKKIVYSHTGNVSNIRSAGISHKAMTETAEQLGGTAPERGEGTTTEQEIQHGRDLIRKGINPQRVLDDFKKDKDKKISANAMAVVRAKEEDLTKAAYKAADDFGENSPQADKALDDLIKWQQDIKPMATEWNKIGVGMQGQTDIDTGTLTGMKVAFNQVNKKPMTEEQVKKATALSSEVSRLNAEIKSLKDRLVNSLDDLTSRKTTSGNKGGRTNFTESTKRLADNFRKTLKTKAFEFKDENGNVIELHTSGMTWNDLVEIGAKAIEATGKIADGIVAIVDKIKNEDWYKNLSDNDKIRFQDELNNHYQSLHEEKSQLFTRFVDKKDSDFSFEDVKDIWNYAKNNYIDKDYSYDDMINGVATDLGLKNEQVRDALVKPKSIRKISDEMYATISKRRAAINRSKEWIRSANTPRLVKFLRAIPNVFFGIKVFGHGTVGMITHAGINIFQPTHWKMYFRNFKRQFEFSFGGISKKGKVAYEQYMEDFQRTPEYTFWKRNNLAIDPSKRYDDYQMFKKYLGGITELGDRGFNALKVYRLEMAKDLYKNLSDSEKADPEMAKTIANMVNHSTGTTHLPQPEGVGYLIFAPRLEASRWERLIIQPSKAIATLSNWNNADPHDKVAAKIVGRKAAEIIATGATMLAVNQALLSLTGSNDKINILHPTKSDWLKFKVLGKNVDVSGGMISAMRFVASVFYTSLENQKSLKGKSRFDLMSEVAANYVKGKLSPVASTAILNGLAHTDYMGNVVPWSKDIPKKNRFKYTYKDYILTQQVPIPVADMVETIESTMRSKGMTQAQVDDYLNGIFVGLLTGATGMNIREQYKPVQQETGQQQKSVEGEY